MIRYPIVIYLPVSLNMEGYPLFAGFPEYLVTYSDSINVKFHQPIKLVYCISLKQHQSSMNVVVHMGQNLVLVGLEGVNEGISS